MTTSAQLLRSSRAPRAAASYAPSLRLRARAPHPPAEAVLVAGADSAQRAAVLHELTDTLPAGTVFEEASARWEVLTRAPTSRMVVLSGDLDDVAAASFTRTLAHRHPRLPVVSVQASALLTD